MTSNRCYPRREDDSEASAAAPLHLIEACDPQMAFATKLLRPLTAVAHVTRLRTGGANAKQLDRTPMSWSDERNGHIVRDTSAADHLPLRENRPLLGNTALFLGRGARQPRKITTSPSRSSPALSAARRTFASPLEVPYPRRRPMTSALSPSRSSSNAWASRPTRSN